MSLPLQLSTVKPDFESLLLQLQLYLRSRDTWQDLQTSSTGETLMEMMAAVGALNQFAIESGARETTLVTAVRASSIYAITRMLGVRIHRKSPASVTVDLRRAETDVGVSVSIPAFTQFTVNGAKFFNRYPLMFGQGSTKAAERLYYGPIKEFFTERTFRLDLNALNVSRLRAGDLFSLLVNQGGDAGDTKAIMFLGGNVGDDLFSLVEGESDFTDLGNSVRVSVLSTEAHLYEGVIAQETYTSDGSSFRQLYLTPSNFQVSDVDVSVSVKAADGTLSAWSRINDGMWSAGSSDKVYYDSTSGLGETIITFGDGTNGAIPLLGNEIQVKYAITTGQTANNGLAELDVACTEYPWAQGITTSVISGGANEKPSNYYKFMAPLIFKARNRAVTDTDYLAVALDYPGIVSANIMAQRDIAPHDLRWMNQVQICLLPTDPKLDALTRNEWDDFLQYMEAKKHAAVQIVTKDPTKQLAEIELTLALKVQYTVSSVLPAAEAAVRALFERQSDTLGRRIAVSDIVRAAMVPGMDYVDVNKCKLESDDVAVLDLIPTDGTHFIALKTYQVNSTYSERDIYSDGSN